MSLVWKHKPVPEGSNPAWFVPAPEGDCLECGERIYYDEVIHGRLGEVMVRALQLPKGTLGTFALPGTAIALNWIVDRSSTRKSKPGMGTLTLRWALLATPPPPEFAIIPAELYPPLISNKRAFGTLTKEEAAKCNLYRSGGTAEMKDNAIRALSASPVEKLPIFEALFEKWERGVETYYIAGLRFIYTSYAFTAPNGTLGGFRETPPPPVSGFTWPANMSWLRLSDEIAHADGIFKYNQTWLGGPDGHWDPDLYP